MINFIKKYLFILKIIPVVFLLSNCSSTKTSNEISQLSDIEIYKKGLASLKKGNLTRATLEFDDVFLNYPFSSLSSKSEIMSAYSLYQNNEINKAITKLNSYIEMNGNYFRQWANRIMPVLPCKDILDTSLGIRPWPPHSTFPLSVL